MAQAEEQFKLGDLNAAKQSFLSVQRDPAADLKLQEDAGRRIEEIDALSKRFNDAFDKLRADPAEAFDSAEAELKFIRQFNAEFGHFKSAPHDLKWPVYIRPDCDGVTVVMDGSPLAMPPLSRSGGRRENTIRYAPGVPHVLEFKRKGFTTVRLNTNDLHAAEFLLKMARAPDFHASFAGERFAGDAVLDGGTIYVGTQEGGLLQIYCKSGQVVRNMDLDLGSQPARQVFGPINLVKRDGQVKMIVFCTKSGCCEGVVPQQDDFSDAWRFVVPDALLTDGLSAPPALMAVRGRQTLVIPDGSRMLLVDCEHGQLGGDGDTALVLPQGGIKITSTPAALPDNRFVAGASDGNLYVFAPGGGAPQVWKTSVSQGALFRSPVVACGDEWLSIADDGSVNFLDAHGSRTGGCKLDGYFDSAPLIYKNYAFAGTTVAKEGLCCIDTVSYKQLWLRAEAGLGGVNATPILIKNTLYFGTTAGKVLAIDAERPVTNWSFDTGLRIAGPLLLGGTRVYALAVDPNGNVGSEIFGFDESE